MLISYNWLRELLPGLSQDASTIAGLLTNHAFETSISHTLEIDPQVTVARITAIEPHPNADRLQLVTINAGPVQATVVCGAHNIKIGDIVPYSPAATKLKDDQGKTFTLTPAKIRGVVSAGMLNSPRELGLSDWHQGIFILPPDTPVGTSLADHLPADTILTADISPNRAHDCLSHLGVARELAAILNLAQPLIDTPPLPSLVAGNWQLNINLPDQVWRYIGLVFRSVQIKPSPLWLQARLFAIGGHPINNVVDITNYVLFERGYPCHAFDSAKLPSHAIGIRFARANDQLTTLDNNSRPLTTQNLLITSGPQPVAIAGVIGGQPTEVGEGTKEIFLESAVFHPYTIQQSAMALKVDTESSRRFSKGITPALLDDAAARIAALLHELAGATVVNRLEYYPAPASRQPISFNPRRVSAIAGTAIAKPKVKDLLVRLRCQITTTGSTWSVTAPPDRLDLTGEHDLVEEVIRLSSLQNISSRPPHLPDRHPDLPVLAQWREIFRTQLVAAGLTETYNYSFADSSYKRLLASPADDSASLTITNAIAPQQAHLRLSLLPRLAGNILANKSAWRSKFSSKEPGLFEIGTVFRSGEGGVVPGVIEAEHIGVALVGELADQAAARTIIDKIMQPLGITNASDDLVSILVPSPTAPIRRKLGLPVLFIEINLSSLLLHATTAPDYTPAPSGPIAIYQSTSKFPPVYRDLSLLVDPAVTSDQIEKIIFTAGGAVVAAVDLFDTYQPSGSSQKGFAFHIAYQAADRTLNDSEVSHLHTQISQALQKKLKAQLR